MLQGSRGTGKLGTKYYYYRCPGKDLKMIPKDELEDLVIDSTCQEILTDEMIGKLTKKIMELQEAEQQADPATALRKELKGLKKKQQNVIDAIENGAGSSLVGRLNEIDARIDELTLEIERARLKRPLIPEEIVRGWLLSFKSGDKNDATFRKRLVETFVSDVIVSPDEIQITYNTTEKGVRKCSRTPLKVGLPPSYANPTIIDGRIVLRIRLVQK